MRKRLPMIMGTLIFLFTVAALGWGAFTGQVEWLILAAVLFFAGLQYIDLLISMRLASDWPMAIIWAAGWFAGRESQRKRHAKRRKRFHLIKPSDIGQDTP